ncbi:MAG: hypothetical protein IPK32_10360 [Verrucomicrobiaceae bacterium]|nr:hypothetical protein [Verrucomicrobiaceae bacterium]
MKHTRLHRCFTHALTLIEVLAAGAVVAIGATAAVSLASGSMLQEELAFRVAITRNYQENMLRLWQLGLSRAQVLAIMPEQDANTLLDTALYGDSHDATGPDLIENGVVNVNGLLMESVSCRAIVNISKDPGTDDAPLPEISGADLTLRAYRPRLITTLRTPVVSP